MKGKTVIWNSLDMKIIRIIGITIAAVVLFSCQEVQQEPVPGKAIGEIYVSAVPGSRSVLVKLDGAWRVHPVQEWLHTDVNGRNGEGAFTFSYDSNESDFVNFRPVRKGAIVIQSLSTMQADTLRVIQQGIPDGVEYESLPQDSYIEFPDNMMETLTVLYANLKGATATAVDSWIASQKADINCIISDAGLSISLADGTAAEVTGTLTEPDALSARAGGLNLVLSDFGENPVAEDSYYNSAVKLLTWSYNQPDSQENWLVGGSFYYLSLMEAGYPDTPSWYPVNPSAAEFATDRYIQGSNLTDCIWMTRRDFTPTYTAAGKSWRADYLYASHSVWNATSTVRVLDNVPAGASHKAVLVKIKF